MIDRVTRSFLNDFAKKNGIQSKKDSTLFEHFANYSIIESKTEYLYEIESVCIGEGGTIGIDGFSIIINKRVVEDVETLDDILNQNTNCDAEVVFIQSKTSNSFDTHALSMFGTAVKDFVAEKQELEWPKNVKEKISFFNRLIERTSELRERPKLSIYYVCLGKNNNDKNIVAVTKNIKSTISEENLFSEINVELIDNNLLNFKYRSIGQSIEKTFEFPSKVTLPIIKGVKEAYIGVVDAYSIIELMEDENGEMLNVFYDNIRDFQGENKVNAEISKTLNSKNKDSFAILNNGITIVAEELSTSRDKVTIKNYQIINGCQTSHVLYENKSKIDETVKVPVKLIISENEEITSNVIRSTNRQTAIKEQDLLAFSEFQKRLEDYYDTYKKDEKLYYERRSKQYRRKDVERKRVVDKTTQIKAVASLCYDKPNLATRYFGTVFNELKEKLFKDDDLLFPYYVSSYSIYKIDELFKYGKIDKKYKKIKYHILTMIRYELGLYVCPPFNSKKSDQFFNVIFETLKNKDKLLKTVNSILKRIDSLSPDLEDNEISKSRKFVQECIDLYNKKTKR